ncbi:MAG: hypothetical protein KF726_18640 [Anaerolineae bacterium]|nr:hypothetical protein [Anaerolineae bacterium]
MSDLLLALDLGTTNAKAAVYDVQGTRLAEAAVSYPTYFPQPGWAEQRPADWTQALAAALRQVTAALGERANEMIGIGLSAHGPSLVLIDAEGAPLIETSATWQDERCTPQGQWLRQKLGHLWSGMGSPLHNLLPRLLWTQEHFPAAVKQARYALSIKDYLVCWLTGEVATEPSSGPGAAAWEAEVIAACGWSLDRLPPVFAPTQIVGRLRPEIAREVGLSAGLPVVIGLNDGASSTLSMGAIHPGDAVITLSTNGVLRVLVDSALSDDIRVDHGLFNWLYLPSVWIAGGQTKAGASTLDWFGGIIAGTAGSVNLKPAELLDQLLAEAAEIPPGSHGVRFLPYLMGRGSPHGDPLATAAFSGLTYASTRGDMVRAVLEGTAFALREIADDFQQMGHPVRNIRMSGGGGRSALWRQIIADTLAQPIDYHNGDATLGAAILTAQGVGSYASLPEALRMIPAGVKTMPSEHAATMGNLYQSFRFSSR